MIISWDIFLAIDDLFATVNLGKLWQVIFLKFSLVDFKISFPHMIFFHFTLRMCMSNEVTKLLILKLLHLCLFYSFHAINRTYWFVTRNSSLRLYVVFWVMTVSCLEGSCFAASILRVQKSSFLRLMASAKRNLSSLNLTLQSPQHLYHCTNWI